MMDTLIVGAISIVTIMVAILLGIPIGFTLGSVGVLGMALIIGPKGAIMNVVSTAYGLSCQYSWAVVPMFVTIGSLATISEINRPAFNAARLWLSRIRGGLAMATCLASGAFAACSGSTVANAAVFTPLALPEMLKYGYDKKLSAGVIAASGTFAAMIPPSITMVIYGIITGEPIGKLLIAGVIPGAITVILYMFGIYIRVLRSPHIAPTPQIRVTWGQRMRSLKGVWSILVIFLALMGSIYAGWCAPSAAGAIGAFATLALLVAQKRLTWSNMKSCFLDVLLINSAIFIIIIGGTLLSRFWIISGFVTVLTDFVIGLPIPSLLILLVFLFAFLILGCIMEPASMMITTMPIIYPIVIKMGYNGIWLGILMIKMAEIAMITPPVGLNCFVVQSASGGRIELNDVFRGILPFLVMDLVTLALLIVFPQITLWLPNTMK